jgi:hypothetical protein
MNHQAQDELFATLPSNVERVAALLAAGEVNEHDEWLAHQLVHKTPESELTPPQVSWLGHLADRRGGRFKRD